MFGKENVNVGAQAPQNQKTLAVHKSNDQQNPRDPPVGDAKANPKSAQGQEAFPGQWVNVNKDTGGLKRLAISKNGDAWSIEAWGAGGNGEILWNKVSLSVRGANTGAKSLPSASATWEFGFCVTHLALRAEEEQLVVEQFTIYKDKSGRPNYRMVEKFKKRLPG